MANLAYGLVVLWFVGLIFLTGRALNYIRLILNSLAPGENYWSSAKHTYFGFSAVRFSIHARSIDPVHLTEIGRKHQQAAVRNERIVYAWCIGGFILIACLFTYT